jgi:hypothetical protein
MLRWAKARDIPLVSPLPAYFERMGARDAVRTSLAAEGLS